MRYYVPFLLTLFLIAALLRVEFFFNIAYLLFAVYLLSRLWVQGNARHLRAERRFTDHAFCGDRVPVDLIVRNASWLPVPWLEVRESLPVQLIVPPFRRQVVSLAPRERHAIQYTLSCRQRGYYTIGPLQLRTGDLLGITSQRNTETPIEHLIVYPRVVPLQQLGLPTRSPLAALPACSPLFEDPARVIGVRDYQRGDSPRRIHWTATASAGRLLVKRYQPAIARETLICLDLDQRSYPQRHRNVATELAIVIAASIANHIAMREALPVGLTTEALDAVDGQQTRFFLPPRSEHAHLIDLLEVLARVQVVTATHFPDLLRREVTNLPWGATLAVITGRESADLFDTLAYLRRTGFAVALILVQPVQPSMDLQERADLLSVPIHRIWTEQDVEIRDGL
jgi:uncharacterized protein (DUF58 family)